MSRFRGHVERRLFSAVLLVLGACGETPPPQAVTESPVTRDAAMPVDAAVAPSVDAAVVVIRADAAVVAVDVNATAKTLCADHKKNAPIDRTQAQQGKPPMERHPVTDRAYWNPKTLVADCTIVHERVAGKVVVLHDTHWCPQSGMPRPAPVPTEVQGQKVLVEHVSIRGDGTLVKPSELEWTAFGMVDEPRQHPCGRRFEGLELGASDCDEPGAQLAAMAELEAASVPAFERLARELATWGAPEELVRRARLAMRDEVRHARVMTALAREYGHAPRAIAVPPLPCRSLEAIAHENAIEGCVREAYGALVATYQAERARPELRAAFRAIAIDERRHAELAEDVHAWILGQLEAAAGEQVERSRTRAIAELRASVTMSRASELGMPGAQDAVALCDAYFA